MRRFPRQQFGMRRNRCDTGRVFSAPYARDVVQVVGADAATFLQSQLSQEVRPLAVGSSLWSFLLQPTGKIEVLLRIWRTGDDSFVLDTDAGYGSVMVARLNRFKIRVKAETSLVTTMEVGSGDAVEHDRIVAGWPRLGSEIVPGETIPGGTGLVAIVALKEPQIFSDHFVRLVARELLESCIYETDGKVRQRGIGNADSGLHTLKCLLQNLQLIDARDGGAEICPVTLFPSAMELEYERLVRQEEAR